MDKPRPAAIAPPTLEEKRRAAIAYLGPRYVNHPNYRFDPRHSTNPALYQLARAPYLLAVRMAAERSRRPKLGV